MKLKDVPKTDPVPGAVYCYNCVYQGEDNNAVSAHCLRNATLDPDYSKPRRRMSGWHGCATGNSVGACGNYVAK